MDIDNFESLMLKGLLSALVIFMGFIVYDLAKKSRAGSLEHLYCLVPCAWGSWVLLSRRF